ncbi:MAG TPA: hypothetical protein VEC14_10155 [Reyranellaceae bacterium]|nr:hypothetical protein [Reyranellaceae bacterium]
MAAVIPLPWVQRGAVLLLWALAIWNTLAFRGLYWDGAAFLSKMMEAGGFHDGHTARAHVLWATQAPAVLALRLGVTDTAVLALAYSGALFAVPAALYHLALHRVRHDPVLLAGVVAIVVTVYLPTSFFIVGEYNATYAAVLAAAALVLTDRKLSLGSALWLAALALFCLRSYEAMIYFGPLLSAMTLWRLLRAERPTPAAQLLAWLAAGLFIGAAVVAIVPIVRLWAHDYVTRVRGAVFDFWQNLQFMIGVATLGLLALVALLRPPLLRGWLPLALITVGAGLLAVSPWLHLVSAETEPFPPAHYVARTAAGALLWAMLVAMWLFMVWPEAPAFQVLREAAVGRRLAMALLVLLIAAAVPDIVLTAMWSDYRERFRSLVLAGSGVQPLREPALHRPPATMFRQTWSYPALSLVLRRDAANALLMPGPGEPALYDPACGLAAFAGYAWRR